MERDHRDEMKERALEEEVGSALARLPEMRAPSTLLLRVMREVEGLEALPWYRAGWFYWPVGWRVASIGFLGTLLVGVFLGVPYLPESVELAEGQVVGFLHELLAPAFGLAAVLRIGVVVLEAALGSLPFLAVSLVGVGALLMVAMTLVVGAALRRLSPDWEIYT